MSKLEQLSTPELPGVQLKVSAGGVSLAGMVTMQNPSESIGKFLKSVHEAALADGLKKLDIDVTSLTFVNSSAIRMFIDWATWTKALAVPQRYILNFKSSRSITWQRTSFVALKALAPEVVSVESE